MRKVGIKDIAVEIGVPYLVHFTHIKNLESILEKGLLSRDQVDDLDEVIINDEERYDGRPNTVSLSIAHPNDRMFYKYRDKDEDWCVIVLTKRILWELDCLFLKNNAADKRVSGLSDNELSTLESFKSMYEEMDDLDSREEQCLKSFDPTDKKAEVLVLDHIPTKYILGVVVSNRQVKKNYRELLSDYQVKVNSPDKGVYASSTEPRK